MDYNLTMRIPQNTSPSWGLGEGNTTLHRTKFTKCNKRPRKISYNDLSNEELAQIIIIIIIILLLLLLLLLLLPTSLNYTYLCPYQENAGLSTIYRYNVQPMKASFHHWYIS